jgi:peptide/nickel transport system substrate-binding protein
VKVSKRSAALIATGVAGVMTLAACGGGGGSSNSGGGSGGASGGQAVFGEATDFPENLLPLISAGNATSVADIEAQMFPSTFDIQPDFSVKYNQDLLTAEPTSTVNGNTQTVVYKLNPNAKWSDGTPITADDFEFTWRQRRSADPANGGCAALLTTAGYDQMKSVTGSDNGKTVTVTLSPPFSDWQANFSGNNDFIAPKHIMDKGTPQEICDETTKGWPTADGIPGDISGGPWQLKKENIDVGAQTVVLTPNPNWYGTKPKLDRLVIRDIGNDPTTAVQALSNRELDVIYPQPQLDLVGKVKGLAPNVDNKVNFGLSFEHLDFNTTDKHLADINVRKAFALALDRTQIVKQTVGQFSSDAQVLENRIWLNTQPEYADTAPAEYKQPNVAQAKQLLEQSGYKLGQDGIYTHPSRGRLAIQIDTTANNPLRQTTIEVMIPQLKAAGIDATFNANPDIFKGKEKPKSLEAGGFQAALFAWVGNPFVSSTRSIYQTPQGDNIGQNYSRIGNKQIDDLFTQLVQEPDRAKQKDLGNQIDKLLWDQIATVPLYQKPTFIAYQNRVSGVVDNPTQAGPLWNASTWSVQQ